MFPRVRVPPEVDEAPPPPPPQPATTRIATTSADIKASNLLLTLINLPSSANNSRGSISGRIRSRPERKNALRPRTYSKVPRLMAGDSRLLGLLRGVDRGFHHVAVVLEPRLDALGGVIIRRGYLVLQRDELLIAEPEIVYKRVGHRLIIGEILVDYGGDLRGLVEVAQGALRILEVAEVVHPRQVLGATPWLPPRDFTTHRMRTPRREHEGFLVFVESLHLSEHRGRARWLVLELEVVIGDHVLFYLVRDHGARLDADDPFGTGLIQVRYAGDTLHVGGDRQAEGCRALVPGLEVLDVVLDLGKQLFMVRQPHVLEGVEFASGDAHEQQPDVEGFQLYLFVVEILFQNRLRQVRDGHVLSPPDVPQGQGPARGGRRSPTSSAARQHEDRDDECGHQRQ